MNNQLAVFPPGRAVIFNGAGQPFEIVEREVPALKPGEILVKNVYTTLCGSDIHTFLGRRIEPAQVVLGHEITGDIIAIDPEHPGRDAKGQIVQVGDRITWSIFCAPADSVAPRADIPQKSDHLFKYGHAPSVGNDVFNGGLADYCILRANTALIKISHEIPAKVAATISCAHATVAGAVRVAGDIAGKRVLVFGAGLLGLSCTAMCREQGALSVGLIDTDANRLKWAPKFGADAAYIFPLDGLSPWPDADLVFDMTGHTAAMEKGLDSLAVGGIAVWIGAVFPADAVKVDAQKIVRKILQIRGLYNYNYDDFLAAAAFVEANYQKYPFEELVEKEYQINEIDEAFRFAVESKPVRIGININNQ